jgi:hypothetical protein
MVSKNRLVARPLDAPRAAASRRLSAFRGYQDLLPWQELVQVRFDAFQPMLATRFLIPLLCVAGFTVLEL